MGYCLTFKDSNKSHFCFFFPCSAVLFLLKSYFIARVNVDKYFLISYLLVINGSIFMFVYRMYVELTSEDTCTSEDLSKDEFSCLAVSSHSFVMIKKSISSSVLKKP